MTEKSSLDDILQNMVENTHMILTNDLPSLLQQEEVYNIRRRHKDDILKNIPEAKAAINKTIMEARLDELLKTVITIEGFMNGTSSHPAADGLLEIKDRIAELQQLIKKYGRADNG